MGRCHDGAVQTRPAGCPTLETERLLLRPFRDDDLDDYFAVLDTPEVRRWLHLPAGLTRGDAWQQMAGFMGQWALRGTGQWALLERSSGAFLGRAGLHHPERPDWPGVEVGWTLHPDHWGRGYATEAGAEAIRYAFEDLDLDRIFSCILPENEASQAVAVRLGMELLEERTMDFFPSAPHGIWSRAR